MPTITEANFWETLPKQLENILEKLEIPRIFKGFGTYHAELTNDFISRALSGYDYLRRKDGLRTER